MSGERTFFDHAVRADQRMVFKELFLFPPNEVAKHRSLLPIM